MRCKGRLIYDPRPGCFVDTAYATNPALILGDIAYRAHINEGKTPEPSFWTHVAALANLFDMPAGDEP